MNLVSVNSLLFGTVGSGREECVFIGAPARIRYGTTPEGYENTGVSHITDHTEVRLRSDAGNIGQMVAPPGF